MKEQRNGSVLGPVFLIVLIDMIGFSVVFPLFPAMLQYYVDLEGTHSLVGRLVQNLSKIDGNRFTVVVLFGGILGSLYSLLQFLFAPIWGACSDRFGRRPTLLLTLGGTTLSYVLWFFSGSFLVLVLARLLGGLMAGNISTASAVVADTSEGPDRARGMGLIGAGIGLGFVLGPAIGGITASWNLLQAWPGGAAYGVNPFSLCALASFMLASFNWIWAIYRLPETLPPTGPQDTNRQETGRTWHPFRALRRLDYAGVKPTNLAYFVYICAFAAMEFTLTFLAVDRLDYTSRDNMWMFLFIGLIVAMVQGGLVRRLTPRVGEQRVSLLGFLLTIPGLLLVGSAHSNQQLYGGLVLLAVGSGLVMPCLTALVSRYTPNDRQGFSLGIFRSLGSLARVLGPLGGGLLYWRLGSWSPYYVGSTMILLPLVLILFLPKPTPQGPAAHASNPVNQPAHSDNN